MLYIFSKTNESQKTQLDQKERNTTVTYYSKMNLGEKRGSSK